MSNSTKDSRMNNCDIELYKHVQLTEEKYRDLTALIQNLNRFCKWNSSTVFSV